MGNKASAPQAQCVDLREAKPTTSITHGTQPSTSPSSCDSSSRQKTPTSLPDLLSDDSFDVEFTQAANAALFADDIEPPAAQPSLMINDNNTNGMLPHVYMLIEPARTKARKTTPLISSFTDLRHRRGHYATVWRGRCRATDMAVAVKKIKRVLTDDARLKACVHLSYILTIC
ncbi:hypothetical protein DYB34_012177 [Aphanomyces astaci]|uniref:Protein kinase domain-containing protein n=1 Tax=Aphanomyces astaci TaxID=112090 RepID=A0A418BI19_APHAT|nr:hypothetical protein DYB34_012177 [Aphanomyces astaci]